VELQLKVVSLRSSRLLSTFHYKRNKVKNWKVDAIRQEILDHEFCHLLDKEKMTGGYKLKVQE